MISNQNNGISVAWHGISVSNGSSISVSALSAGVSAWRSAWRLWRISVIAIANGGSVAAKRQSCRHQRRRKRNESVMAAWRQPAWQLSASKGEVNVAAAKAASVSINRQHQYQLAKEA